MPEINERLDALQKQVAELMDFKAKVERRHRLLKLYPLLSHADGGIHLDKEFEDNKRGLYCPNCLEKHESLEPISFKGKDINGSPAMTCSRCQTDFMAQKTYGFSPVSLPADI